MEQLDKTYELYETKMEQLDKTYELYETDNREQYLNFLSDKKNKIIDIEIESGEDSMLYIITYEE